MVAVREELENLDASGKHARRLSAKEVLIKMVNISNARSQMEQSNCLGEIRFSEGPPQSWIILHVVEEHSDDLQGETDASHPIDTLRDDGEARNDFWSTEGNCIYRHHVEPIVENSVCRMKNRRGGAREIFILQVISIWNWG